ncbi:hypothetical protein FRC02_000879 [Tulasnella sp. 418]|nr:hypothetical protein FRC02_000879 [Tulasnella sp. 418]
MTFIWLTLLVSSVAATTISSRQSTFIQCLDGTSGITVLDPSDSGYQDARLAFNRRLSYSPAAIVYPTSVSHVQQAVKCAATSSVSVVARSGGHSYAAFGLGGKDGSLVIDLSKMKSLQVDQSTGYAVTQTGNRLGDVAQKIWDQGQRALPHGTCPYVGSGGHTSYGGFGMYGRTAGLLLDRVVAAEVVLADGTVATASDTSNSDLFWALRGAAPSFGIVTAWTFATLPAPTQNINWNIDYSSSLSKSKAVQAILALQTFAASNPSDKLSVVSPLSGDSSGISISFSGTFYGSEADFLKAITPFKNSLPSSPTPKLTYKMASNWIEGLKVVTGPLDTSKPNIYDTFFAKSLFVSPDKLLTNSAVSAWVDYMMQKGSNTGLWWWVEIDMYGGAIANVGEDSTAYAHRNAILNFQLYGGTPEGKGKFPSTGISFINGLLSSLEPSPKAAYPNYIDPTLSASQWQSQYFGTTKYQKLAQIKKKYDPKNVFNFPQAIQPQ